MGEEPFTMPLIHGGESVTWTPTAADREQARQNHDQTLERLRQRGGVDWGELEAILRGMSWSQIRQVGARERCLAALAARASPPSGG